MMNRIYSIEASGFIFHQRLMAASSHCSCRALPHTDLSRGTRCHYNMPIFKGFYSYLICMSKHSPKHQQTSMDKDILYMHMHIKDRELCTRTLMQISMNAPTDTQTLQKQPSNMKASESLMSRIM